MPVPAVPRASLVVSKSKLRLSRLERVLDGPTPPLNRHQGGDPGPGRAPGREEGKLAIVQAAADQKSACPQAGEGLVVFGRIQVGQLAISPVIRIPGEGLGLDSWAAAKRIGWCAMSRGGEAWRGLLII